jgi:hypothetical protein
VHACTLFPTNYGCVSYAYTAISSSIVILYWTTRTFQHMQRKPTDRPQWEKVWVHPQNDRPGYYRWVDHWATHSQQPTDQGGGWTDYGPTMTTIATWETGYANTPSSGSTATATGTADVPWEDTAIRGIQQAEQLTMQAKGKGTFGEASV